MSDLSGYVPGLGRGITIGAGDMNPALMQYTSVTLTSTQVQGMSAAPVQLIAPAGASTAIVVTDVAIDVAAGTAYAAGGAIGISYGGTATFITNTIGSAILYGTLGTTTYLGTSSTYQIPSNTGVFIGNQTAAFTTGTEPVTVNVWYAAIPTSH